MDPLQITILVVTCVVMVLLLIFLLPGLTGAPYVPTLKASIEKALTKLYPVGEKDLLIDLGAGDGVVLYTATKHGAKALGLEINPILTLIAKWRFRAIHKASVKCCNFYRYRFPKETTVVYAFAVTLHIEKIHRKIAEEATRIGHPIYFISNAFDLKDLKPEKQLDSFYLYKIEPTKI